ncbi:hypothetical protein [Mycobacterium sp. DL440]|uniref:hypothetical protein n=1 Tax=Mycobacterium sp. DL440 TaxID=2675523 RepID=UPI001AAFC0FA|nr:hypothetical protein [Mycobacterium sp. DL440]
MNRVRRRLLLYSAPVVLVVLIAVVKLLSVVVIGHSAANSFADRDTEAMAGDVARLRVLDIVQPGKAEHAAGALAVLENRLDDADRHFRAAVARLGADESCSARVDLELVRETLGDRAIAAAEPELAVARYLAARDVVERAAGGCFAGNNDPDPDRRAIRNDALGRLNSKIDAASAISPPPVSTPPPVAQPPPPATAGTPTTQPRNRLDPTVGDPLDRLQQILRDAATG